MKPSLHLCGFAFWDPSAIPSSWWHVNAETCGWACFDGTVRGCFPLGSNPFWSDMGDSLICCIQSRGGGLTKFNISFWSGFGHFDCAALREPVGIILVALWRSRQEDAGHALSWVNPRLCLSSRRLTFQAPNEALELLAPSLPMSQESAVGN